jgi:hypothetical protein
MAVSFGPPHYRIFELPKPEHGLPKTARFGYSTLRALCGSVALMWGGVGLDQRDQPSFRWPLLMIIQQRKGLMFSPALKCILG